MTRMILPMITLYWDIYRNPGPVGGQASDQPPSGWSRCNVSDSGIAQHGAAGSGAAVPCRFSVLPQMLTKKLLACGFMHRDARAGLQRGWMGVGLYDALACTEPHVQTAHCPEPNRCSGTCRAAPRPYCTEIRASEVLPCSTVHAASVAGLCEYHLLYSAFSSRVSEATLNASLRLVSARMAWKYTSVRATPQSLAVTNSHMASTSRTEML